MTPSTTTILNPTGRQALGPKVTSPGQLDRACEVFWQLKPPCFGADSAARTACALWDYEQPLVVPQLLHTKQAPARCMTMPHW
jgi:hypothetical protein